MYTAPFCGMRQRLCSPGGFCVGGCEILLHTGPEPKTPGGKITNLVSLTRVPMQLLTVWTTDPGKHGAVGFLYHLPLSLFKTCMSAFGSAWKWSCYALSLKRLFGLIRLIESKAILFVQEMALINQPIAPLKRGWSDNAKMPDDGSFFFFLSFSTLSFCLLVLYRAICLPPLLISGALGLPNESEEL